MAKPRVHRGGTDPLLREGPSPRRGASIEHAWRHVWPRVPHRCRIHVDLAATEKKQQLLSMLLSAEAARSMAAMHRGGRASVDERLN
jgi:hypothetical protein